MPEIELTLESLKDLDFGKVEVAFRRHLKRAVDDCMDRDMDHTARVVALVFKLAPEKRQGGPADRVLLQCQVTSKVPPHASAVFRCAPRRGGQLAFKADCEDVDQGTFSDLPEQDEKGQTSP